MPGVSKVPANGRQTSFLGAIWVPSAVKLKFGLGRRYAVISCALNSSIPNFPASKVGLFCSKRCRTCSQVKGSGVCASTQPGNNARSAKYFQKCFFMMVPTPQKSNAQWPSFSRGRTNASPPPARTAPIENSTETRAPSFIDLLHEHLLSKGGALVQASEAGGARPQSRSQSTAAAYKTCGDSTSLLAAGKAGTTQTRAENSRKTRGTTGPGTAGEEASIPDRMRDDLLSSTKISWSCKSSVMEITKNRMTRAQLIATIFRQWFGGRSESASARDKLRHSSLSPTIATHSQTRLSASSTVFKP